MNFILVTSGAVGIGKHQLRKQRMLTGSLQVTVNNFFDNVYITISDYIGAHV